MFAILIKIYYLIKHCLQLLSFYRRQRWAESKLLEEEVARRLERYLDSELAKLLVLRKVQFNAEIERRVEAERTEVLRRRAEEAERKAREEAEALQRREVRFLI